MGSTKRELLGIGDIAKTAGQPIPTIRHYTKLGLLKIAAYTDGGRYLYDKQDTLDSLKYIDELSNRGLKLNDIKNKFSGKKTTKSIVIIESNESYAKFIKSILGHICPFWQVEISSTAFDAGHMLVDVLPDLVLLDVNLADSEREKICSFVKENIALRHTKIIVLITEDSRDSENDILSMGIDACSMKPIDIEKLMKLVKKVLHL